MSLSNWKNEKSQYCLLYKPRYCKKSNILNTIPNHTCLPHSSHIEGQRGGGGAYPSDRRGGGGGRACPSDHLFFSAGEEEEEAPAQRSDPRPHQKKMSREEEAPAHQGAGQEEEEAPAHQGAGQEEEEEAHQRRRRCPRGSRGAESWNIGSFLDSIYIFGDNCAM